MVLDQVAVNHHYTDLSQMPDSVGEILTSRCHQVPFCCEHHVHSNQRACDRTHLNQAAYFACINGIVQL